MSHTARGRSAYATVAPVTERPGDDAAGLRLFGPALKRGLVKPGDVGLGLEIDLDDGGDPVDSAQMHPRLGLDRLRRVPVLCEVQREGH